MLRGKIINFPIEAVKKDKQKTQLCSRESRLEQAENGNI